MNEHAIATLRAALHGTLVTPGDAEYDVARRGYYSSLDRRPLALARVAHAQDVARVIAWSREHDVPVTVRGGGHSIAGHSVADGAIAIDMREMNRIDIDPATRTAWAEGGVTAGAYLEAAAAYGLATPFGDTGSVGVAGITLGGGVGFLHRKYGLTIDNVIAADVVTADGELLHVNATSHGDLFRALLGGGGNFGVVTRIQYRLHAVDDVVGGMLMLPATPHVVAGFLRAFADAPEEMSGLAMVMCAPPMPFIPAEHHGQPIMLAHVVCDASSDDATRILAPFRDLAPAIMDDVRPRRYVEMFESHPGPDMPYIAFRNFFAGDVTPDIAGDLIDLVREPGAMMRATQFRALGGAVSRVPADATSYAHRDRGMMVNVAAAYSSPDQAPQHEAWVARCADLLSDRRPGAYVNFLGDEGEARVREAYPGETWARLRRVKAQYDPHNVFAGNQNIPPATNVA